MLAAPDGSHSYDTEVVAIVERDEFSQNPDALLASVEAEIEADAVLKRDVGDKKKDLVRVERLLHLVKESAKHAQKGTEFRVRHRYATVAPGTVLDFKQLLKAGGLLK